LQLEEASTLNLALRLTTALLFHCLIKGRAEQDVALLAFFNRQTAQAYNKRLLAILLSSTSLLVKVAIQAMMVVVQTRVHSPSELVLNFAVFGFLVYFERYFVQFLPQGSVEMA